MRILARLFLEMFKVAFLVIGGGFAIIAAADDVFSRRLKWTKEGELVDAISLFQAFPGIMAGHCAVYIGRKVAGAAGAAVALSAVAMPSLVVFLGVAMAFDSIPSASPWLQPVFAGLRASVTGIVAGIVVRGWRRSVSGAYGVAALLAAIVALGLGANPAIVVAAAMLAGVAREFLPRRCGGSKTYMSLGAAALIFLKYGFLAFGGGYVLVPMYMRDFVGAGAPFLQMGPSDFANLVALTQMTPGPIGLNAATFFGFRMGGIAGSCIATMCLVLPGSLLLFLALGSLERYHESRVAKGILFGVKPVTTALMVVTAAAFLPMAALQAAADGTIRPDCASIEIGRAHV